MILKNRKQKCPYRREKNIQEIKNGSVFRLRKGVIRN